MKLFAYMFLFFKINQPIKSKQLLMGNMHAIVIY